MRHEITRSVPGLSSAGRARRVPWRAIYSISPCQPCASHSSSRGSAALKSASAMPTAWKPSSRPQRLMLELRLPSSEATLRLGEALAAGVAPGGVLFISGDLGAGKTTLVRGLLKGLGYAGRAKSPTYALVEPYMLSSLDLYHFDFYRFKDRSEWLYSGFREHFNPGSVCIVEWPEKAGDLLAPPDVQIRLDFDGEARRASLEACSDAGRAWLSSLSSTQ